MAFPLLDLFRFFVPEELPPEELRCRLSESVRWHQMLRTLVVVSGWGMPYQAVLKELEIPFFTIDLRALAGSAGEGFRLSDAQEQY